jgi:hypothetical protein
MSLLISSKTSKAVRSLSGSVPAMPGTLHRNSLAYLNHVRVGRDDDTHERQADNVTS